MSLRPATSCQRNRRAPSFTFGSDRQANWPAVAKTIDGYQTKMLAESDGTFRLSKLGLRIKDEEAGIVDENAPPLAYDPELPKA